jgi:hypothetical protein
MHSKDLGRPRSLVDMKNASHHQFFISSNSSKGHTSYGCLEIVQDGTLAYVHQLCANQTIFGCREIDVGVVFDRSLLKCAFDLRHDGFHIGPPTLRQPMLRVRGHRIWDSEKLVIDGKLCKIRTKPGIGVFLVHKRNREIIPSD